MKDDILRNAEMFINVAEVKQATEDMKEFVPLIASMTMEMYRGFVKEGFSEQQAFSFAKEYTLKLMFQK